jgi:hypothetical protein
MATRRGVFFYVNFNLPALLRLAEQLRDVPCTCDSSKQPESGSWNWAIFISFEDGLQWVFLSPRKDNKIAAETEAKLLESHVATLKLLKLNSPIPVPEVFDYRCVILIRTRLINLMINKARMDAMRLGFLSFS